VISPPLTLNEPQIDELAGILRQAIEASMADLRKEDVLKH
jgi:adenosylmethionine-8-amino-7-oxononanoate aminotransferase